MEYFSCVMCRAEFYKQWSAQSICDECEEATQAAQEDDRKGEAQEAAETSESDTSDDDFVQNPLVERDVQRPLIELRAVNAMTNEYEDWVTAA